MNIYTPIKEIDARVTYWPMLCKATS